MDKVAVFGDVHGQAALLEELIWKIKGEYGEDVEFYSLGDLIDRGPDSCGVIDLCVKHNVKGIMGNHELWLRNLVQDRLFDPYALEQIMGGEWTCLSYDVYDFKDPVDVGTKLLNNMPDSHKDFLMGLPDYRCLEIDGHKYWLIHAGLSNPAARQFVSLDPNSPDEEMMERLVASGKSDSFIMWPSPPLPTKFRPKHNMFRFNGGTQILGHRPLYEPMLTKDFIAMDTGCGTCAPFTLSAILLPSREVVQVSMNKWA